ncbi:hypothetical protein [Streptomyces sp. NBC_01207]|uniref:hypothetical protein n=1 Tax=Streptomyces sp. NBC_01207 TaxID=2903772 RepID=UPI002E10092C|nr:hypothetical protein OG457_27330 [Streptomyces sp. NBC_01207]
MTDDAQAEAATTPPPTPADDEPAAIADIRRTAEAADAWAPEAIAQGYPYGEVTTVRHTLLFTYGAPAPGNEPPLLPGQDVMDLDLGADVCEITAEGPLPIPTAGEIISVHGVHVRVNHRVVDYSISDSGVVTAYASIDIEPVRHQTHRGRP